jgi:hypothetical protein
VAINFHTKTSRIEASALPKGRSPPGGSGGSLDAAPHWCAAIPTIADRRGKDFSCGWVRHVAWETFSVSQNKIMLVLII